jgi:hypothetical protein
VEETSVEESVAVPTDEPEKKPARKRTSKTHPADEAPGTTPA